MRSARSHEDIWSVGLSPHTSLERNATTGPLPEISSTPTSQKAPVMPCAMRRFGRFRGGGFNRPNTLASDLKRWNGMHMEGHARTWFTRKQKAELWER